MSRIKRVSGVITILVSLMLTGILSLGTLVLEAGRLAAARTQLAEASSSAATSMIASFDQTLYDRFGLLAIDTDRFTPDRCQNYIEFNSDLYAGYMGNNATKMYDVTDVELSGLYNLTYPSVLKRQLLSRAKYHVALKETGINQYNMDTFFADYQQKCDYVTSAMSEIMALNGQGTIQTGTVNDQMKTALELMAVTMGGYADTITAIVNYDHNVGIGDMSELPSKTGTIESALNQGDLDVIHNTHQNAADLTGSDILTESGEIYSEVSISVDGIRDLKDLLDIIGDPYADANRGSYEKSAEVAGKIYVVTQAVSAAIDVLKSQDESNLLLNSYITAYFNNNNCEVAGSWHPDDGWGGSGDASENFAGAAVEYVFGGMSSELKNQEAAMQYMLAIRLINNLYSVLNSSSYDVGNPGCVAAHICWAYYESLLDLRLTTSYNAAVPFTKNQLFLRLDDMDSVITALQTSDIESAIVALGIYDGEEFVMNGFYQFDYTDSLGLALWLIPNSQKLLRVADLIQMEMRYKESVVDGGTAQFLMSEQNTYCRVAVSAELNALLPVISMSGGQGLMGLDLNTIKYVGY